MGGLFPDLCPFSRGGSLDISRVSKRTSRDSLDRCSARAVNQGKRAALGAISEIRKDATVKPS